MSIKITIRKDLSLGTWLGLGGAITEATAYNFSKLSPAKQKQLLDAYYGKNGLDYRWGRIPIGSCDFCLEPYEYTKRSDLSDFSIAHDEKWLLPMLRKVNKIKKLTFVAAPWSPPSCLKFLHMRRFGGKLKPWHYKTYAEYLRRWLNAYKKEGITIDYLSPQNEPFARQIWESCRYSFRAQRKLAKELSGLGPKLLLWDHNKKQLARVADELLPGTDAGLCFHWYDGTCSEQMWKVHQKYPNTLMVSSEMCCGFSPYDEKEWQKDAVLYLKEIMTDINCGTRAWIDWNMLLDHNGGPSYCKNYVKSPVILNEAGNDFILTPIYEALKTFAKLFPAGSETVRCDYDSNDVVAVARKIKNSYEVVVANLTNEKQVVTIDDKRHILAPYKIAKL
jgi:glucosylceramidase